MCFRIETFNDLFRKMKALGVIDTSPWGKCRRLPDGSMQMFVRDPAGNLLEFIAPKEVPIDPDVLADDLVDADADRYVSARNDTRGFKSNEATLHHTEA